MKALRRARRADRGYTLIELVMVILILGIILSITFTRIESFSPKYSLRAAARRLARILTLARSQAAVQGRPYFLKYKLEDARYYLLVPFEDQAPPPTDTETASTAPPIPQIHWEPMFAENLPDGIRFRDILLGGTQKVEEKEVNVEISPFGITQGHVVHLTDGKGDYTLDVNPLTGHVRFHEEYWEPPALEED